MSFKHGMHSFEGMDLPTSPYGFTCFQGCPYRADSIRSTTSMKKQRAQERSKYRSMMKCHSEAENANRSSLSPSPESLDEDVLLLCGWLDERSEDGPRALPAEPRGRARPS